MNKIKFIYGFVLFAAVIAVSCADTDGIDQDLSFLKSAKVDGLGKAFDISNDNSGLVKITPFGNGVSSFTVAYGHGSGEDASTTVIPGYFASHIYPEGSYTVSITSKDVSGTETVNTYPLEVTYKAPENVEPNISKKGDGIALKPKALYAGSFMVYFGDVPNEVGTPCALGGMVNHLYEAAGDYDVKVVAISGNASFLGDAETELVTPTTIASFPAAPFAIPITFEDGAVNYFFGSFGGGQAFSTVDNPSMSGLNTSAKVGKFTRGFESWSGTYSPLSFYMDFATTKKVKLLVYNPDPGLTGKKLNLELEASLGGIPGNGVGVKKVEFTTSGEWEELVFDFSTINLPANAKFGQIVFRFNDSYSGAGTGGQGTVFYIDDIRLTN